MKLKRDVDLFDLIEPHLIHNDISPEHVLVENGTISGLIDFESAVGADPVQDFAYWDYKQRSKYLLKYIVEGYCSDGTVIDNFERRLNYWKIYRGLASLRYCIKEKKQRGIEKAMWAITDGCEQIDSMGRNE